jgi:membrane fusion protein, multidrug efflux system
MLTVLLTGCGGNSGEAPKGSPPVPVDLAEVTRKDMPLYVEGIGHVAAYNTVEIKCRVTGQLIKTLFKRGDFVTEGQPLFIVDPAPFEAKVKEGAAKLRQAQVLYEQARKDYSRFYALHGEKAVSLEQLETKQVDMNAKHFATELYQAELESAKLNLGYCSVNSPLDGQAGEIYIDDFNIVNANQDKLVTVKQIRPIRVRFSVPGKYLDEIRKQQNSKPLSVEAIPVKDAEPETGSLTLVDNAINPKTGMINMEGTFANPETRLWPGQFVQVRLQLSVTRGAVLAPHTAVHEGPNGRYVWAVSPDQTVAMRPVKVDRRAGDMEVIAEGLDAGERVVTDGYLILRPGAQVITREEMSRMQQQPPPGKPQDKDKTGK